MILCPKCNHSPWPFAVIFLITGVIGFLTWLILGLSPLEPIERAGIAVAMVVMVGGTLLHYVLSCLRRHCRHQHDTPASQREALN